MQSTLTLKDADPHDIFLIEPEIVVADAVLHTHSIWSTLLSDRHAAAGGLAIEGYEMLKGLEGVATHEHREWIPILENDQDMVAARRPSPGRARPPSGLPRVPPSPPRVVHLGRNAGSGRAPRGDRRVPARGRRPDRGCEAPWHSSESRPRTPRLTERRRGPHLPGAHGIDYEQWAPDRPVAADADADAVLAAYGREIETLKARGGYRDGRRDRRQARDAQPRRDAGQVQPRTLARRRRGALHHRGPRPVPHSSARQGRSSRSRSRPAI